MADPVNVNLVNGSTTVTFQQRTTEVQVTNLGSNVIFVSTGNVPSAPSWTDSYAVTPSSTRTVPNKSGGFWYQGQGTPEPQTVVHIVSTDPTDTGMVEVVI